MCFEDRLQLADQCLHIDGMAEAGGSDGKIIDILAAERALPFLAIEKASGGPALSLDRLYPAFAYLAEFDR